MARGFKYVTKGSSANLGFNACEEVVKYELVWERNTRLLVNFEFLLEKYFLMPYAKSKWTWSASIM